VAGMFVLHRKKIYRLLKKEIFHSFLSFSAVVLIQCCGGRHTKTGIQNFQWNDEVEKRSVEIPNIFGIR
jgi:hypothetical protein